MSLVDCINDARDSGVISASDAKDLRDRFERYSAAAKGDASAARARLTAELDAEGVETRRRELLSVVATDKVRRDIASYRGPDGKPDVASAILRLFEHVGHTGYQSVKQIGDALISQATSGMEDALHAFRRSGWTMRRMNKAILPDIVRAAFGETKSEEAKAFYASWRSQAERLRMLFNDAGGAIGWREDYGLPTWHDGGAVLHVKFDRWRAFIDPRLDWEKIRSPLTGERIDEADRADTLQHVYNSIVTDGWNTREPTKGGGGSASLALSRQDARFLTFKNADAWNEYSRAFGRGDPQDVMMGHIRSMAREVALMQKLGPNPSATVQWLKQIVAQEAGFARTGEPSLFRRTLGTRIGDVVTGGSGVSQDKSVRHAGDLIDSMYEIARSASQPHAVWAKLVDADANAQSGAKLGRAIITHALINPLLQVNARLHYGIPVAPMLGSIIRGFDGQSGREIARAGMIMQDAMHSLEGGAREAGLFDRMVEKSKWLPAITTHYTVLDAFVQASRRAYWWDASAMVASHLGKEWDSVPARVRSLLAGFGLDEKDWGVMRAAEVYEPASGARFLRWQEIAAADRGKVLEAKGRSDNPVNDAAAAPDMANETAMKYLGMLNGVMEFGTPSSRWRSKAAMTGGLPAGSIWATALRSPLMFKSFLGSATVSFLEALRHELAANKAVGAAAAGANLIALGALGVAVLQAKSISAGKDPRSMDPRTKDGLETIMHGFLTSGALSVYGDFLASDHSSYGHDIPTELAGPLFSSAVDAEQAVEGLAVRGFKAATGQKQKPLDIGGGVAKFLANNTELLSTHWALSAAYHRIFVDQLQYMTDPQAHDTFRRMEQGVKKDTNQNFYWRPGQLLPDRLPAMTPGRN